MYTSLLLGDVYIETDSYYEILMETYTRLVNAVVWASFRMTLSHLE